MSSRRLLFENFAEASLGKDPFAGGNRQVRPASEFGHDFVILCLARLLDEHGFVRLQRFDQNLGWSITASSLRSRPPVSYYYIHQGPGLSVPRLYRLEWWQGPIHG